MFNPKKDINVLAIRRQHARAVEEAVQAAIENIPPAGDGSGDMLKSVYDLNNNGIVDNSERLGSQLPAYYLNRLYHTGTQDVSTITGLGTLATQNGTFSGTSSGTNTGDQNLFASIAVSGQPTITANSTSTVFTILAGSGIVLTTDNTAKTLTITSTASGVGTGVTDGDKGDITVSSGGATWTIDSQAVTFSKIQNVTAGRLLGRTDASSGAPQEITIGSGLTLSGTTLTATATGGGSTTNYFNTIYIDQSAGSGDTYGVLAGAVNGSNQQFTVSQNQYASGLLKVYLNGQLQTQGSDQDWVEVSPAAGTFSFNTAPLSGDLIAVEYQVTAVTSGSVGGTITLTGAVTGAGTNVIATTLAPSSVGLSNLTATGTPNATKYLRGDNTWATVVAGGSGSTNDIELTLQMVSLISYVEFTYDGSGNLTNKDIWEDNTKTNKYYSILYNYTDGDLTSIDVTREVDAFTYTKTYAYSGGNLASITIT